MLMLEASAAHPALRAIAQEARIEQANHLVQSQGRDASTLTPECNHTIKVLHDPACLRRDRRGMSLGASR